MMDTRSSGWTGFVVFAGVMMLLIGTFTLMQGLVALFAPDYYVIGENQLLLLDFATWGWVMLAVGLLVVATGIGLLAGQTWARVLGIIFASLNAIGQVAFLAAFPVWSILVIALDVFVIYAIAVYGGTLAESAMGMAEEEKRRRPAA